MISDLKEAIRDRKRWRKTLLFCSPLFVLTAIGIVRASLRGGYSDCASLVFAVAIAVMYAQISGHLLQVAHDGR